MGIESGAQGFRIRDQKRECCGQLHSRKLTWNPKRGPIKTTVPPKWGYMGFHVSLGECTNSHNWDSLRILRLRVRGLGFEMPVGKSSGFRGPFLVGSLQVGTPSSA